LPENNRHWTTNWEFRVSDKPPTTNVYAGHEDFSGTTISLQAAAARRFPSCASTSSSSRRHTDRPKDAYGVRAILPRPEGRGLPRTGSVHPLRPAGGGAAQ